MSYPYKEHIEGNANIRKFSSDVDEMELVWHRDREDRLIESTHDTDWKFQFDNEIPESLNNEIFIKKGEWHRVIKGSGDLILKVIKYD
jgi:hypothetical protein|tara:strand:+ start:1096 stop:1359 length:264 start_codon:yes stop_codon:yes gene_type:complete